MERNVKILFMFCFPVIVITALIYVSQLSNQVVRNLPSPPAPVIPELPGLVSQLRSSKDLCESRAQAVIAVLGSRPRFKGKAWDAKVFEGRLLYDQARAEFNGCIEFLRTGLSKRFAETDSGEIAKKLEATQQSQIAFIAWANRLDGKKSVYQTSKDSSYLDLVIELIKSASERNDKAIELLREDLQQCRLRAWNEL